MGTISNARITMRANARLTATRTNVDINGRLDDEPDVDVSDSDIAYSVQITGTGAGDVATLTLTSGDAAQTTGTPTIVDDEVDFEGKDLVTASTIRAILINCDDNGTDVTIELKDDGATVGEWSSDGAGLKALHAYDTGMTAADKTLVVTMAGPLTASLTTGTGDAGITWTAAAAGSAGNDITVVTTDAAASAETLVTEVGNAITVTRAAKARMQVNGTMTSDGSTPVTFGILEKSGEVGGRPSYEDADGNTLTWSDGDGAWILQHAATLAQWIASDHPFPDIETWTPGGGATGVDTVTALYSSAAQVSAAASGLTIATTATEGDGSETFAAVTPAQNLTGGVGTGQPVTKLTIFAES